MRTRLQWLEENLSPEEQWRLVGRRDSVVINQGAHDMIMILAAHGERNPMNDEDEDDNHHHRLLLHQGRSMTIPADEGEFDDNEGDGEEEIYFTTDGSASVSPRFDAALSSRDGEDSPKIPPLIHTNTILRLCPDIESTTVTIGAAGSMKIASKLLNIASDARRTLSQSSNLQKIEEETIVKTSLSSPSVMKWLRKVSFLVSALSSMEISDGFSRQNSQSQHEQQHPSLDSEPKFESLLYQVTEKPKTPLDLNSSREKSLESLFVKGKYQHLESPDPLIELFTIPETIPSLRKQQQQRQQRLYSRASSPTVPRKQRGPHLILSNPNQLKGYRLDETDGDRDGEGKDPGSNVAVGIASKSSVLLTRNGHPLSSSSTSSSLAKIRENQKSRGVSEKNIGGGGSEGGGGGGVSGVGVAAGAEAGTGMRIKMTQHRNRNRMILEQSFGESPISDSLSMDPSDEDKELDPRRIKSRSPGSGNDNGTPLFASEIEEGDWEGEEHGPESAFIHDDNPGNHEIDCFEEEYELYSQGRGERGGVGEVSMTVGKLAQTQTQTLLQQQQQEQQKQRQLNSQEDSRNALLQLPRNNFSVVDTRRFSPEISSGPGTGRAAAAAVRTGSPSAASAEYRIAQHISFYSSPVASESQYTQHHSPHTSPSSSHLNNSTFMTSPSLTSSSLASASLFTSSLGMAMTPTLPSRPLTTGSVAMDRFYNKQYEEQLTSHLLTNSITSAIQHNPLKIHTLRSHSAQRYRKLRSPANSKTTSAGTSRHNNRSNTSPPRQTPSSSTLSLPTPTKPSPQYNPQIEKIFLNSSRHETSPSTSSTALASTAAAAAPASSAETPLHHPQQQQEGNSSPSHGKSKSKKHYMERTGHLRSETYDGVKKSLHLVTYFTENNY
jgi:hypothetical protein